MKDFYGYFKDRLEDEEDLQIDQLYLDEWHLSFRYGEGLLLGSDDPIFGEALDCETCYPEGAGRPLNTAFNHWLECCRELDNEFGKGVVKNFVTAYDELTPKEDPMDRAYEISSAIYEMLVQKRYPATPHDIELPEM